MQTYNPSSSFKNTSDLDSITNIRNTKLNFSFIESNLNNKQINDLQTDNYFNINYLALNTENLLKSSLNDELINFDYNFIEEFNNHKKDT